MPKTIIVTESQFLKYQKYLTEDAGPLLDNGDVKEFGDPTQVSTSATVHNVEGKPKHGKDVYDDEVAHTLTYQNYFGNSRPRV